MVSYRGSTLIICLSWYHPQSDQRYWCKHELPQRLSLASYGLSIITLLEQFCIAKGLSLAMFRLILIRWVLYVLHERSAKKLKGIKFKNKLHIISCM